MNNQFSQRVSDIITYSKEEANRLRNRYIGPEHLLLGMLRDGGGKAIEILLKLDIDLKRVKSRLEGFLKDAEDDTLLPDAEVPLSPMTAKILKMCMLEARLLNEIERYATARGIMRITSEVSLTARPFFEKRGYIVEVEQKRKANQLYLTNFWMAKRLAE